MLPKKYLNNSSSIIGLMLIILLSLMSSSSATTFFMGNINENLELCIYRADGILEGCIYNGTSMSNITREDYYMELRPKSTTNYFIEPLKITSYFPPLVYIILNFIIIIVIVGGLFLVFRHLLFGKPSDKYNSRIKKLMGKERY